MSTDHRNREMLCRAGRAWACDGKAPLTSTRAFHLAGLRKYRRAGCAAYRCPVCGWWHIGKRQKDKKRRDD